MEILLPLLLGGAILGVGLVQRHRRLQAWQAAAAACGLEAVKTSGWRLQLTARAGPLDVGIETCGNKGRYTRIVLQVPGLKNLRKVRIRREPLLRLGQEIVTGDAPFDSTFFIEGPMRQVLALLDAETRRLIGFANSEGQLEVSAGTVRAEHISSEQVSYILPLLLDIGRRLSQPLDVLRRLTENACRDPEPGVRLSNLLLLVRELPGEPWTVEALRTACSDPSPGIRLRAAQELGAEGRGVLLNLAEGLEDDASSAQAVSHLGRELPFERTQSILFEALRRRRVQTARACLEALGQSGDAAAVDALAKVVALEKGELAPAAALALGATGSPAAEAPLIEALQREEADLRIAAASALSRVGSVEAVLPLKEAAERSWLDLELRRATRQAIAEIQSRLQGASPGQLSLAGTEAGQLSLIQDEAGQLSLPPEPPVRQRG
jgi:HEAT repeat protein